MAFFFFSVSGSRIEAWGVILAQSLHFPESDTKHSPVVEDAAQESNVSEI